MEQEKEKFTEFEDYLHNKIIEIYGEKEIKDDKEDLGSCKIPNKVLNMVREHKFNEKHFQKKRRKYILQAIPGIL